MGVWLLLIVFHAASAVICLASGIAIIMPDRASRHSWLMLVFIISLIGLILFVTGAVAAQWLKISGTQRLVFSGLIGLALYMLYRGLRAAKKLHQRDVPKSYIDDVGFVIISLLDAFTIVSLIDLGAPVWLVVVGAILGVVVGILLITSAKKRFYKQVSNVSHKVD
jgi:hypothetical protein